MFPNIASIYHHQSRVKHLDYSRIYSSLGFCFPSDQSNSRIVSRSSLPLKFKRFWKLLGNQFSLGQYLLTILADLDPTWLDSDPKIEILEKDLDAAGSWTSGNKLISKMEYLDQGVGLIFFELGCPVYKWYTRAANPGAADVRANSFHIQIAPGAGPEHFIIGMPFWGRHRGDVPQVHGGIASSHRTNCVSSFLAIGMTNHDTAYIVHGVREVPNPTDQCSYRNDLKLGMECRHWSALVFLAGWDKGKSSLGTMTAISPEGRHIAAANWDCVLVWTFDPSSLSDHFLQGLEQYFPPQDYNPTKNIGRLKPIKLANQSVVYSMLWVSECVLFAWTEHGLMQWDMRITSNGRREDHSLDWNVCFGPVSAWLDRVSLPRLRWMHKMWLTKALKEEIEETMLSEQIRYHFTHGSLKLDIWWVEAIISRMPFCILVLRVSPD